MKFNFSVLRKLGITLIEWLYYFTSEPIGWALLIHFYSFSLRSPEALALSISNQIVFSSSGWVLMGARPIRDSVGVRASLWRAGVTPGYRQVPIEILKILGTDGYRVPGKFSLMPTPGDGILTLARPLRTLLFQQTRPDNKFFLRMKFF